MTLIVVVHSPARSLKFQSFAIRMTRKVLLFSFEARNASDQAFIILGMTFQPHHKLGTPPFVAVLSVMCCASMSYRHRCA